MTDRGETLHWQPWTFLPWLRKRVDTAVAIEIVLIALLFVIGFIVSTNFRTIDNLVNIIEQSTGLAFVALGQTVVILSGGIDLSLDATIALASSLLSGAVNGRAELAAPMIAAVLAIGVAIGLVNGALDLAAPRPSFDCHPRSRGSGSGNYLALYPDADWWNAGRI